MLEEIRDLINTDEITCDNEGCRVYGESRFCRGRERECILYTTWEKKMIRNSRYVQRLND